MARVLFVPVSGPDGAGEYYRSVAIAEAVKRRWPKADITFVVNCEAGYAQRVPFPARLIDGSPTRSTEAVNRVIEELRPDVVVFDSAGRHAQLKCARKLGAHTVYISSRVKTRWKGFRLRRMRLLDQHWLVWPQFLQGGLNFWEKLKLKLIPSVRIVPLNVLFPPPDTVRAAALQKELGVEAGKYVLMCAGGGGYHRGGRPAPETFADAAALIRQSGADGMKIVFIRGPNYAGPIQELPGVVMLGSLSSQQLIDMLDGARLGVVNGGSLLLQALSLKLPCVAAPVAADQNRRIDVCTQRGLASGVNLDAVEIAAAARALLEDGARHEAMRRELRQLNLANGIEPALEALAPWMNGDTNSRSGGR